MIPKGLFSQLGMIAIAVAIVFTYIQPLFTSIQETQVDIATYQSERQKVSSVNALLATQVSQLGTVSSFDQQRLATYMPEQVDDIAVSRVIESITAEAGVLLKSISYTGVTNDYLRSTDATVGASPVPHSFQFMIDGTYPQIKNLLRLMEQNNFPLEVYSLSISVLDGGFLSASIEVVTYSNSLPVPTQFAN